MLLVKAKRVIKSGFVNFWRNGWVSLATVLIAVITLFTIGSLIFARVILTSTLDQVKDKVDVSVYFKMDAEENDILALEDRLEKLDEVKAVEYVSREEALEKFRERHKDNALIIQSLEEIGGNPLGAVLNVKAKETSQYEGIAKFLEDFAKLEGEASIIDKVNFAQNKLVIERLSRIIDASRNIGAGISVILVIISVLVIFNTIRLAIYTSREEIGVMKLVGASSRFVKGPFVVEGVIYGIIAAIVTMLVFYPFTLWLGPMTESFFGEINIHQYYLRNFAQILLVLLFLGVGLSVVSSLIAVRRYLRV